MSYRKLLYGTMVIVFAISLVPHQAEAVVSTPPRGWLDSCVVGWALDVNTPDKPISVHVYVDKPAGVDNNSGFVETFTTNVVRDDVNAAYHRPAGEKHGFEWSAPKRLFDGQTHTVYVYGIDTTDTSGGSNALLDGAPQQCQWSDGADTSSSIIVSSPASGEQWQVGTQHTISWVDPRGSAVGGTYAIQLEPYIACLYATPVACKVAQPAAYTIVQNLVGSSFSWNVPNDLPSQYRGANRVRITLDNFDVFGLSSVFSIASNTTAITITSDVNPLIATVGQPFSASFSVSGGTAPYQWQQTYGAVPEGISITFPAFNCITTPCVNPYDTAIFKGTPTRAESATATFRVTDSAGRVKETTFTITVSGQTDKVVRTGYVDVATNQRVEGWAFDSTKPGACLTISYGDLHAMNSNALNTFIVQEVCPTLVRTDAADWVRAHFGGGLTIGQPLGFRVDPTQVLSPGTYMVVSARLKDSGVIIDLGESAKFPITIADDTIAKGPIVIKSPAKGDAWQVGQTKTVTWSGSNNLPVNIRLVSLTCGDVQTCPNISSKTYSIANGVTGTSYNWSIADNVPIGKYRIYMETSAQGVDYVLWGQSGVLTITSGGASSVPLQVTSPAIGDTVYAGEVKNIMWNVLADTQGLPVTIKYNHVIHPACRDAVPPCGVTDTMEVASITAAAPNTGSYAWSVPTKLNGTYTVSVSMGGYTGESGQFTIVSRTNSDNLVVKVPAKDEIWSRGETHTIYWSPNVANTKVSVSVTRYIPCLHNEKYMCAVAQPAPVVIETSAPDTGSFEWSIPKDFSITGSMTVTIANTTTGKMGESSPFQISDGSTVSLCSIIKLGQIVVGTSGTVYVITPECNKYGFTSLQDLTSRGYSLSQVQRVDQAALDAIPTVEFFARPANTSFRYSNQRAIYYLSAAGCKEVYPSLVTLRAWGISTRNIVTIPASEQYSDCNPSFVRLPNNTWAQVNGEPTVYHVEGTVLRPYASLGALISSGFQNAKLYTIRRAEFNLYTVGEPL